MPPASPPERPSAPSTASLPSLSCAAALQPPPRTAARAMDFPQFMMLPAEIRTMVWAYALPEPRVYEIMDVPGAKQKMNAVDGLMFANVHHEPPPALAAVCLESRCFVLRHYRALTLGRTTKYVDLARDLLLLEPYLLLKRLHRTLHFMSRIPLIRTHMAGLALGTSYGIYTGICHPVLSWKASKSNVGKLLTGLAKFPRLKTLLFVVHQEFQFEFDCRSPPPTSLMPSINLPSMVHGHGQLPLPSHIPLLMSAATTSPAASAAYTTPSPQPLEPRPQVIHQAYRFKFDVEDSINRQPRRPHLNDLLFYPIENSKPDDERDDDWEALLNSGSGGGPAALACAGEIGGRDVVDMDDTESGEWNDPWPTNDDWRRFRCRFQRAVVLTLQSGLVSGGDGQNALCVNDEAGAVHATSGASASARSGAGAGDKKYQHFLQQQKCDASGASGHGVSGGFAHGHAGISLHSSHRLHASSGGIGKNAAGHHQRYSLTHQIPAIKGVSLLWRYTRGQ